jgi:malonyl-CoA decarboxylase
METITRQSRKSRISNRIESVRQLWRRIAARSDGKTAEAGTELGARQLERIRRQMRECVNGQGGEISARARAARLGATYLSSDQAGKRDFLKLLTDEFGPDPDKVDKAIDAYRSAIDKNAQSAAEGKLREALRSPRSVILTQFNALPSGVKFLVDLRADVLRFTKSDSSLAVLDHELKSLLAGWFDVGFLELQRITWNSPAALLEKLISYEAVHEIRSWNDLRNRLDSDRRCYAYFHPRMPQEPLIFVEVALTDFIAGNVQALLDETAPKQDPRDATTAVFYSISSTQAGLRGISFGNFLIKRVADDLAHDLPHIKTFVTLSPIPLFRAWLDSGDALVAGFNLPSAEQKAFETAAGKPFSIATVREILKTDGWQTSTAVADALREPLLRLCARYLAQARIGSRPYDPVARFHLGNGARIRRIHWLGDTSKKGLQQSAGMMVNYLYDLSEIEENHERFARDGRVAMSPEVRKLLKAP